MSKNATPAEKPKVTVTRPEATVTITIQGVAHKMTEAEAKELHANLGKALGVNPEIIIQRERDRYERPFRPWPHLPPPMLSPQPQSPRWGIPEITC